MRLNRKLRARFFLSVPVAGAQAGYSRSDSYRRASDGTIPTVRDGKLLLVPKKKWSRKLTWLLREIAADM
jgi:hypothetical protein